MITLQNSFLKAGFMPHGAELRSLRTTGGREIMWQADAAYWAKTSPVLFPVVGALKEGYYIHNGEKYELPRHGFARDLAFEADVLSGTAVRFTLRSNEETRKNYPFDFIFMIDYLLEDNRLTCSYTVENPAESPLYFSLGAHPAFLLGNTKEDFEAYELWFPADDELVCSVLYEGLTGNASKTIKLHNRILPLDYALFYEDALVLKSLKSNKIHLRSKKEPFLLEFRFEGFPYFGIWSAPDANFICLEPWCGIADSVNHDNEISGKEGIRVLHAGEIFRRSWSVIISQ